MKPFTLIIALLLIWEGYTRAGFISEKILPPPTAIWQALLTHWQILLPHTMQTLVEALIGLAVAIILGIIVAIFIFLSNSLRKAVYPILVFSQTIPIIALAPLLLIWFGFDLLPKVIIVALYCFFPITIAVSDALLHTDAALIDLLRSMRATKWQMLWFVRLPAALPAFLSGLRIAVTYAMAGAIVGEYVGAYQGLGVYMQRTANTHAVVLIFASLAIIVMVTIGLLGIVFLFEKILTPWKKTYV